MKKTFLVILFSAFFIGYAFAGVGDFVLNTPETESAPEVTILSWHNIDINVEDKMLTVFYFKKNSQNQAIPMANGKTRRAWYCQDTADNPDTPQDETDTCWSDIFRFQIRSQDVGTAMGIGLRNLIMNKMKNDSNVMSAGNNGNFNEN